MAECVRSEFIKESQFEYRRKFFQKRGELLPQTFEFVTEDKNNEFQHAWSVKYSVQKDKYTDVAEFEMSRIEVSTREKLMVGDIAHVIIIVNRKEICLNVKFDSKSPTTMMNMPNIWIDKCDKSQILIKIKIERHFDRYSNQMVEDFTQFFENDSFSDVTFIFEDKEITAHKQILAARNSVFRSMFENDMLEKKNGRVEIKDMEPYIFKLLLQFIYSEKFEIHDFQDWLKLIVAADRYSIKSLVKICEDRIFNNLSIDNVVDAFITVDLVNAEVLKKRCVEFILKNRHQVVQTEAYKSLVSSPSQSGTELLRYLLEKV